MRKVREIEMKPERAKRNSAGRRASAITSLMLVVSFALIVSAGRSYAASESVIHAFEPVGGENPAAGVVTQNGKLYGTTSRGGVQNGGTVFELTPPSSPGGFWTILDLHAFTGGKDGSGPVAGLLAAKGGTLYGTTASGGSSNFGTVFKEKPPAFQNGVWTESVLYSFKGGIDGSEPVAGLIAGQNGVLYGTTKLGGTSSLGTVFELMPPATPGTPWTESVLYSFAGGADGETPVAGLVAGKDGTLYGTTSGGGTSGLGTVFALTPPPTPGDPWTEGVLYSFPGAPDGNDPVAGLIIDQSGTLYGTTLYGGLISSSRANGSGTVFTLTPPAAAGDSWAENIIYSFGAFSGDGYAPVAGLLSSGGMLTGTTTGGSQRAGGTVYQLTPPAVPGGVWTETILHQFSGGTKDGSGPSGGVIVGPNSELYGTTQTGGAGAGLGTVFEVTP